MDNILDLLNAHSQASYQGLAQPRIVCNVCQSANRVGKSVSAARGSIDGLVAGPDTMGRAWLGHGMPAQSGRSSIDYPTGRCR